MLGVALPTVRLAAKELRVGYSADIVTLDPANHRSRVTESVIHNMYDAVLTRAVDMKVVPELAESFRQLDATTYEARLRPGIRFHDGSTLTAEDVKFTFDRPTEDGAMEGETSPRKSLVGPLAETNVVHPLTVRFRLAAPWPVFPAYLPFNEVVSKTYVEKVGSDGMATRPMGTGPFRLVEWRKGDSVILERFPDYYGGASDIPPIGPARVERVIFKIIRSPLRASPPCSPARSTSSTSCPTTRSSRSKPILAPRSSRATARGASSSISTPPGRPSTKSRCAERPITRSTESS